MIPITMEIATIISNRFSYINGLTFETIIYIISALSIIFLIVSFIVSALFIMAQQRLVRNFSRVNKIPQINNIWLWSQLIPIWSYIALVIAANKLNDQNDIYIRSNNKKKGPFKVNYIYWYVSLVVLTLIPILSIIAGLANFIIFILVWANINKASKILIKENNESANN